MLFDKQPQVGFNPKQWEQAEGETSQVKTIHTHTLDISDTTYVPSNRNVFIACRKSQLSLMSYLALKMLALSPCIMTLTVDLLN